MKKHNFTVVRSIIVFLLAIPYIVSGQISKTLTFETNGIQHRSIKIKDKGYEQIDMKDAFESLEVGKPNLPVYYYKFYVPQGKSVIDVNFKSTRHSELQLNMDLIPVQRPVAISRSNIDTSFNAPDLEIYNKDALFPEFQARVLRSDFVDGNMEIVTIEFYPIQYNPKHKKLQITSSGVLNLITKSKEPDKTNKFQCNKNSSLMSYIAKSLVENSNDVPVIETLTTDSNKTNKLKSAQLAWSVPFYEYVVITKRALKPAFTQFVSWKKRKGFNAGVVCIEDILADLNTSHGDPMSPDNPRTTDDAGKFIFCFIKTIF